MQALIMGGGMSGLATAINLLDHGFTVELVEADAIFGGRATSWRDQDGDMIDNALHVFFPYYVNLLAFFRKLGIADDIVWKASTFTFAQDEGRRAVMRFADLPAPLHAAAAYASLFRDYRAVPKWKALLCAFPMLWASCAPATVIDKADDLSWAEWTARRMPRGALKFMEPGMHGLTFTPGYALSAKVMLNWMHKVGAAADAARVGFANGGLGEIWVDRCLAYIRSKGGVCATGQAVTALTVENGRMAGVTVNGAQHKTADIYVSAMSPFALRQVLPPAAFQYAYFQDLTYFQNAPSLSIQVWFDRQLTDVDATLFSTDCIFNTYADLSNVLPHIFTGGSMFEMVIAPADAPRHLPDEIIFQRTIADIRRLFPAAREAQVRKYTVVRERQGVYRPFPGMEKHRPCQRSPYANFYLTGDYTKTPVSSGGMEAAVWTANRCAELICQDKRQEVIHLNTAFTSRTGFTPYIRPALYTGAALAALALGKLARR